MSKEELDQDVGLNLLTLLGGKKLGEKYAPGGAAASAPLTSECDEASGGPPNLQPPGTPVSGGASSSLRPSCSGMLSGVHARLGSSASISGSHSHLESAALEGGASGASGEGLASPFTGYSPCGQGSVSSSAGASEEEREAIAASIIPAMEAVLATVEDWRFDAFKLAEVTQGHPLSALGFWLFKRYNLIEQFQLDAVKLARFLRKIEDGYPHNP